jgi:hypothetical protein
VYVRNSDRYASGVLLEVNSHSLFSKWFSESGPEPYRTAVMYMGDDTSCMHSSVVYGLNFFPSYFNFNFNVDVNFLLYICKHFYSFFFLSLRQTRDETVRPYPRDSRGDVTGPMSVLFTLFVNCCSSSSFTLCFSFPFSFPTSFPSFYFYFHFHFHFYFHYKPSS